MYLDLANLQSLFQLAVALNVALVAVETFVNPYYARTCELYNKVVTDIAHFTKIANDSNNAASIDIMFRANIEFLRINHQIRLYRETDSWFMYRYMPRVAVVNLFMSFIGLLVSSAAAGSVVNFLWIFAPLFLNFSPMVIVVDRYERSRKYVEIIEPLLYEAMRKIEIPSGTPQTEFTFSLQWLRSLSF